MANYRIKASIQCDGPGHGASCDQWGDGEMGLTSGVDYTPELTVVTAPARWQFGLQMGDERPVVCPSCARDRSRDDSHFAEQALIDEGAPDLGGDAHRGMLPSAPASAFVTPMVRRPASERRARAVVSATSAAWTTLKIAPLPFVLATNAEPVPGQPGLHFAPERDGVRRILNIGDTVPSCVVTVPTSAFDIQVLSGHEYEITIEWLKEVLP